MYQRWKITRFANSLNSVDCTFDKTQYNLAIIIKLDKYGLKQNKQKKTKWLISELILTFTSS